MAAAPESTVRRVSDVFEILSDALSWPIFVLPMVLFCWLHAEISPADAVVRPQGLIVAFERDAARFENVAMVGGFKRLCHALFDQQDRQVRLPANFNQPFENEIRGRRRQAHRW